MSITVLEGREAHIGDRVQAAWQRWGYALGTATVEGFGRSEWIDGPAVIVREDNGEISTWCHDRVYLVEVSEVFLETGSFESYMRRVADRPPRPSKPDTVNP